jgi:hypothetical protein
MRIGFVRVLHEYVVDLDDLDAVKRARSLLKKDLMDMVKYPDQHADLDRAIGVVDQDSPPEVIDEENADELATNQVNFTSDPMGFLFEDNDYSPLGRTDTWEDPGGHVVSTETALDMIRMTLLWDSIEHIETHKRLDKVAAMGHSDPHGSEDRKTNGVRSPGDPDGG